MSEFDLHNNIDDRVAFNNQAISSDVAEPGTPGEIIDTSGFESIAFITQAGDITDGDYTIFLEEGDDAGLSDATAVTSDETLGELPSFNMNSDNETSRVGSIGKKRYQRLSIISANTTSGGLFSAVAILSNPHTGPVPQTLPTL